MALHPTVKKAAGYAAASLDDHGLPPAGPDYWEVATTTPSIGTAAPLPAGLHGRDSAVTFMAPPFNHAPAHLAPAIDSTYQALLQPNGGDPGQRSRLPLDHRLGPGDRVLRPRMVLHRPTPEGPARRRLAARPPQHARRAAEKIDSTGSPASVVPLVWTGAIAVLALVQMDGHPVPTPPV
jgi:hypothetical protein